MEKSSLINAFEVNSASLEKWCCLHFFFFFSAALRNYQTDKVGHVFQLFIAWTVSNVQSVLTVIKFIRNRSGPIKNGNSSLKDGMIYCIPQMLGTSNLMWAPGIFLALNISFQAMLMPKQITYLNYVDCTQRPHPFAFYLPNWENSHFFYPHNRVPSKTASMNCMLMKRASSEFPYPIQ